MAPPLLLVKRKPASRPFDRAWQRFLRLKEHPYPAAIILLL
jgi:hypothetical protein